MTSRDLRVYRLDFVSLIQETRLHIVSDIDRLACPAASSTLTFARPNISVHMHSVISLLFIRQKGVTTLPLYNGII